MTSQTTELDLEGMTCAACAARIEKVLKRQPGVTGASVNFAAERARIEGAADAPALIQAVEKAGYRARVRSDAARLRDQAPAVAILRRFFVSATFTVPAMVIAMGFSMESWAMPVTWILATPVQLWAAHPFTSRALRNARHRSATMDTLVAIGTWSAYSYSAWATLAGRHDAYFETAATIVTLILLGRYFELSTRGRASAAIRALAERGAKVAMLLQADGTEEATPIERVGVGDRFVVRPGEKIATDGVVIEGSSAVDESLVTGESVPREKTARDGVIGGTVNAHGRLIVEATKVGADTALAQIARLVEDAQAAKAPIQRLADRVAGIFVPAVLLIAVATFAGWMIAGRSPGDALIPAVAVLIIACPCAMGLATPAAIMVGTARGAAMGVLIKGGDVLERSRSIDTVVLDKTGTITEGAMRVTDVVADTWNSDPVSEDEVLERAATVEQAAEHPIAVAVAREARDRGMKAGAVRDFVASGGLGALGIMADGTKVVVGRASFLADNGLMGCAELDEQRRRLEDEGKTVFGVGWGGRVRGLVGVADQIKPSSPAAVSALQSLGAGVVMLTGDNASTAAAIAARAGIDQLQAEVLPGDKAATVASLQSEGRRVAVAGDGVNDAPALAQSDLGIAVGTGADVAIEAADITLIGSDLLGVPSAIRLARRTYRAIVQNLFWAFGYNVALVPLAAAGKINPTLAAAAMGASSISVVANALRLRRVKAYTMREQI